jgi:hypothetical protein
VRRAHAPPADGAVVLLTGGGLAGELLEEIRVRAIECCALAVHPALELVSAGDVEPVEERTLVDLRRPLQVVRADRRLEVRDIDRHAIRVEPQLAHALDDVIVARLSSNRVERLRERVTRALVAQVGPQRRDDLVSRNSRRTGPREKSENGQPTRLRERAGHRASVAAYGKAT